MADAQDLELGDAAKGGKKKLIIIIAVVVVLLGGGAAAFLLMGGEKKEGEASTEQATKEPIVVNTTYINIPESIVVNIPGTTKSRTLKMNISFSVANPELGEKVKKHLPLLRSEILTFTAMQDADLLMTVEGQSAFREQVLVSVQTAMEQEEKEKLIDRVLFTAFVMQ